MVLLLTNNNFIMIKKSISVMTVIAMVFAAALTVNAQEDKSYTMWQSVMLTPDNSNLKALGDSMRAHNMKYHQEGPYRATVFMITTGPNAGNLVWMMGPLTFSDNDNRPSDGGHDEDWGDNVMKYVKKIHTIEYWTQNDELSNTGMLDGDSSKYPLIFVRYGEVEKGHGSSLDMFYGMISKTVKAMEGVNPWGLYYNEFRQGDLGRHVASVSFYKNWTDFDNDKKFKKTFIEVHGEDKWEAFLDMGRRTFSNAWDEIWKYNAHMSGR